MKLIALTAGDPNGVGLEVTAKALQSLGPQKNVRFFLFRSPDSELQQLKKIDLRFKRIRVASLSEALVASEKLSGPKYLFDIESSKAAPYWVEEAATACSKKVLTGLVTAPLSKGLIQSCGFKAKGHTEILQKISKTKKVHMVFVGDHFTVLLATAHISLKDVSKSLTPSELRLALNRALLVRNLLPASRRKKPIGLLGLNPHAGENGILGHEETRFFHKVMQTFPQVSGPLSPDAAFLKKNWNSFSLYVACYHDQGLIPFKMIHGTQSGYHLTFGLPFIRTSVDHGTAFDIYGHNKADGSSMKDAIKACIKLSR